jgi:predicted dehydrogenase
MAERVRIGLIGCGKIGLTHARSITGIPSAEFAATCDADGARAEAMAEQFGVPRAFSDVGEMLRSGTVDAVTVCTPHPTHADVVVAAAAAGVHVICEKPLAVEIGEANRMVEAAERGGIHFAGIFQRRFWPAAQRIRTAIDDGKLGRITHGECRVYIWRPESYFAQDPWRGTWANEGGGALMNQAVHAIDLLQWYLGPVTEVFGRWAKLRDGDYIDVEDTAVATLVCANGALATIQASTNYNPQFGFHVQVHGTSGATASVWEMPEGVEGITDIWTVPGEDHLIHDRQRDGDPRPGFPEFHRLQLEDFVQAIQEGRPPAVSGAEAKKALEIILAIYESTRTGLPVKLPLAG